jgi:hypothetical protein
MKLDAQQRMNFTLSGLGSFVLGFPETGELHGTGNSGGGGRRESRNGPVMNMQRRPNLSKSFVAPAREVVPRGGACKTQNPQEDTGASLLLRKRDLFVFLCAQKTRHEADYSHENLPSWMPKSSSSMKAVHEGADACAIMHTGDNGKANS